MLNRIMRRYILVILTICLIFALAEDAELPVSERLSDLGYLFDEQGEVPEYAIKNFQRANALPVTGMLDENTLDIMFSDKALSIDEYISQSTLYSATDLYYTDIGGEVVRLKKRLNLLGYYETDFDEIYDLPTAEAVARFQMANGLNINGDAWGATAKRLYSPFVVEFADYPREFDLSLGDSGYAVKQMQDMLLSLGYYGGELTGLYGKETFEAVRAFQRANGYDADGVWHIAYSVLAHNSLVKSAEEANSAAAYVVLTNGYTGYEVVSMENALYSLGYFSGKADEVFDDKTEFALKLFQEANQLEADGRYGSDTRAVLLGNGEKTDYTQFRYDCMEKTVCLGDRGYAVWLLTSRLKQLGYPIDVTENFDEKTLEIVLKFQKAEGLEPSGETDAPTRARLYEENCMTYAHAGKVLAGIESEEALERRRAALEQMLTELIDMPYAAGMTGPDSFGVGGFIYYCMQKVEVEMPPTCALQYELAVTKESFSMEPADIKKLSLVFFEAEETIYSGIALGEGLIVYASPLQGHVTTISVSELMDSYIFKGTVDLID